MLDDKRNPETTYRLVVNPDTPNYYEVTVYPAKWGVGAARVTTCIYRGDLLPAWMHDTIMLLDVAGSGVDVWTIGLKTEMGKNRTAYWFSSKQHEELLRDASRNP